MMRADANFCCELSEIESVWNKAGWPHTKVYAELLSCLYTPCCLLIKPLGISGCTVSAGSQHGIAGRHDKSTAAELLLLTSGKKY
jgi:hypothetical protein